MVYLKIAGCGASIPGLGEDVVPIAPRSASIQFNILVGGASYKSFRRSQLPLVPAYSYTDYKSQGRTLERAVVDLATARGQGVYVMLSRVKSLDGLMILRWFPSKRVLQRMSAELRAELLRIDELDRCTRTEYERYSW